MSTFAFRGQIGPVPIDACADGPLCSIGKSVAGVCTYSWRTFCGRFGCTLRRRSPCGEEGRNRSLEDRHTP